MPTSPYMHITAYIEFLTDLKPSSILEIGLGNGKLGFIARDLLDVMYGERYKRTDWNLRLDGIEVFGDYIQAHQKAIYDTIYIGDAYQVIDELDTYDVIVMGDVLEHFPKHKGLSMLDKCIAHLSRALILFVPLGDGWAQPAIYGNDYERHRSIWRQEEFESMSRIFRIFEHPAFGYYGAFLISEQDYIKNKIVSLKNLLFNSKWK